MNVQSRGESRICQKGPGTELLVEDLEDKAYMEAENHTKYKRVAES